PFELRLAEHACYDGSNLNKDTSMNRDLFNLEGQTAAVIGGTGTLGGAMASALATFGAKVAIVGRHEERGVKRVHEIETAGGTALYQAADALDRDSLLRAREAISGKFGSIGVLVNAAGGNRPEATLPPGSDFCQLPLDAWRQVFDLNL